MNFLFLSRNAPKEIRGIRLQDSQAAVYAADGYSRSTGKISVVLTFGLKEAFQAASALLTSWGDKQSIIVVNVIDFKKLDVVKDTYSAVVYSSYIADKIEDTIKEISKIIYVKCPVQIIISPNSDLTALINEISDIEKDNITTPVDEDSNNVEKVFDFLGKSINPIILLGSGAIKSILQGLLDVNSLSQISEILASPILLTSSATCMPAKIWEDIKNNNKNILQKIIPAGNIVWIRALASSDFILALGSSLSEVDWFGLKDLRLIRAKIVRVGLIESSKEIGNLFLKMEVGEFVKKFLLHSKSFTRNTTRIYKQRKSFGDWKKIIQKEAQRCENLDYIEPCFASFEIANRAKENTIFVSEGGACGMWLWSYLWFKPLVFPVQMGTIGVTIPMSIGAKIGNPDYDVWSVFGDGAFFYNIKELKTVKELRLPIVFFVYNNSSWGAIRLGQNFVFLGRHIGTDLPSTDYAQIAKLYGCEGITVEKPKDLISAIEYAKGRKTPLVVDVKMIRGKDSVPYTGANFVIDEFDGVIKSVAPYIIVSSILGFIRGRVPINMIRPLVKMIMQRK